MVWVWILNMRARVGNRIIKVSWSQVKKSHKCHGKECVMDLLGNQEPRGFLQRKEKNRIDANLMTATFASDILSIIYRERRWRAAISDKNMSP